MNKRWVILRHTLSKESMEGIHFDLLLEDGDSCRTWRLTSIPIVNGPLVRATLLSPHKIYWLHRKEAEVSGGRGWAKRIHGGNYSGSLPLNEEETVSVEINSSRLCGLLELKNSMCKIICSE